MKLISKKKIMEPHYTTDTKELAPYPGMSSSDLRDFEAYADEMSRNASETLKLWAYIAAFVGLYMLLHFFT